MLAFAWPVAILEGEKISLIDSIQHRYCHRLDYLVSQHPDVN